MQQVLVYTNVGAIRCAFDENGEVDEAGGETYKHQFKISNDDNRALTDVLEHAGYEYWQRYQSAQASFRSEYPSFSFNKPVVANQGEVKLTLSPLPQRERSLALKFIEARLKEVGRHDLLSAFRFDFGGRSTIDVLDNRINKAFAIRDAMDRLRIIEGTKMSFPYFGDSFEISVDQSGRAFSGNDVSVLDVPNVIPIAVNLDQKTVVAKSRVIAGGSGPGATIAWLRFFDRNLLSAA